MSPALPASITAPLAAYLDEDADEAALRAAARAAAADRGLDLAALFDGLQRYRADPMRKARAEVVLRAALQLPLVAGPVCRPTR